MLMKLFIISAVLLTVHAGRVKVNEKNVSFSVNKIWQSYEKKDDCCRSDEEDEWKEAIQDYYDGCRKATWEFRGPYYNLAESVVTSFEIYVHKLIYFSNSNSTLLASSAIGILGAMSKCKKLQGSGLIIIKEFDKVILEVVNDFTDVVTKLSGVIGELTCKVNDVLHDLGCACSAYMKEFLKGETVGRRKKANYEPVFKQYQKLMNTVALIAETLLNKCQLTTNEVEEAVTVLGLVLNWFGISIQGINSCVLDILYNEKADVSQRVASVSTSLDYVLVEVTQSVASLVFPLTKSITKLLSNLVNITMAFNKMVKDILGLFKGVSITVGLITQNLSKSVSSTVTGGITKGLTHILKGIAPK